ncbi:hypothetical protein BDQ17DRAFT_1229585 [Cyathus striatus]|nr:hypothetical protein BDQ17DRAFT_1229585 [Cyathus striatus]
MPLIASFFLRLIHFIYAVVIALHSFWKRRTMISPLPIGAPRRRIPKHLALLFVVDSNSNAEQAETALVESVVNAVEWCRTAGIENLTVYEESGLLISCSQRIYDSIPIQLQECSSDSEIDYPLTPPPSDYSESRSLSPQHQDNTFIPSVVLRIPASPPSKPSRRSIIRRTRKRKDATNSHELQSQKPMLLFLVSREASKPAIASAARYLVQLHRNLQLPSTGSKPPFRLSVDELNLLMESKCVMLHI